MNSEDEGARTGSERGGGRVEAGGLRVLDAERGVVRRCEETSSGADFGGGGCCFWFGSLACGAADVDVDVDASLRRLEFEYEVIRDLDALAGKRGARALVDIRPCPCPCLRRGEWTRAMRSPKEACIQLMDRPGGSVIILSGLVSELRSSSKRVKM